MVIRGVSGSGAQDLEALPGREDYPAGDDGDAQWAEAMLLFEEDNFEGAGTAVRSMDQRGRKVGLFGDFLERVGHGKFVEWRANESIWMCRECLHKFEEGVKVNFNLGRWTAIWRGDGGR